jgi:hypothetical protein
MATKTDDSQPTRNMVERLLRVLAGSFPSYYDDPAYKTANDAAEARYKKLTADPVLTRLRAKADAARVKAKAAHDRHRSRVELVRNRFLSEGATPAVLSSLRRLVREAAKASGLTAEDF